MTVSIISSDTLINDLLCSHPLKESFMTVVSSFSSVFAIGLLLLSFFLIQTIERMPEEVWMCWGAKSWEKVQAVKVGVQR